MAYSESKRSTANKSINLKEVNLLCFFSRAVVIVDENGNEVE